MSRRFSRFVEIFDLDAVVGVDAAALRYVEVVVTKAVIVGNDVHPGPRGPLDLSSQTLSRIGRGVGLPSIDNPRLDLQMGRGENLDPQALEKPWRVGGNIRGLVGPVIEVVVAEQADVGHENSRVDVDPVQRVNVIAAVGFCQVAVRIVDIPLSLGVTGVIAHGRCGVHAKLGHESGANVVVVEVAAEAELLQLDFVGAKELARPAHRVVDGFVEIVVVGNIGADFRGEEVGIKGDVFVARVAVEPGPVPIRERIDLLVLRWLCGRGFALRLAGVTNDWAVAPSPWRYGTMVVGCSAASCSFSCCPSCSTRLVRASICFVTSGGTVWAGGVCSCARSGSVRVMVSHEHSDEQQGLCALLLHMFAGT